MNLLQTLGTLDWHTMEWHWLRPLWLAGIFPALLLAWLLWKQPRSASRWSNVIDAALLPALLGNDNTSARRWPIGCLLAGWLLALIALAGPSWEKTESQTLKQADAVVILFDLSPSMLVKDIAPSRLQAAQYKILDLLKQRHEGYTGLIAYAGSAHVVAPLSDDTNTIAALVPSLEPGIMPKLGSNTEAAITAALALLDNAHFQRGRLLLITDGVVPEAVSSINEQLKGKPVELHVIGVGTAEGGPIPLERGGFIKDEQGKIQLFPFASDTLNTLARQQQGHYSDLRIDDADIAPLVALPPWLAAMENSNTRETDQTLQHWQDNGYWLLFPLLLLALPAFRRGLVVGLLPLLFIVSPETSQALEWNRLWYTPDQLARQKLEAGDAASAAQLFEDPQWKAYAEYRNNEHAAAAEHFANSQSAEALYNRGNALAKDGQLGAALDSYEAALKQKADFPDAIANRDLVKSIIEKQQQQQQNQPSQDQQNQQPQDQQNQQSQDQQNQQPQDQQNQQSQDQQNQQAQDQQNQQSQDQQNQQSQDQQDQQAQDQQNQPSQDQQNRQQPKTEEQQAQEKAKAEADQKQAEEAERQQQAAREQAKQQQDAAKANASAEGKQETPEEAEKRQATEQWLRKVPDDPGGLLRNKFDYYYQQNQRQENRNRRSGNAPDDAQRW